MKFILPFIALTNLAHAAYLPEKDVRDICFRNFARTISCTATYNGKSRSIDVDKESLKARTVNYGEYGISVDGFYKTTGLFGGYPRWKFNCDSRTGKLTGTEFINDVVIATEHGTASSCR